MKEFVIMIKEKQIWLLAKGILDTHGELFGSLHLIPETIDGWIHKVKVYHNEGYCFELERQEHCDAEDYEECVDHIVLLQKDGCTYHFDEPWDGFKVAGIDKAIDLLKSGLA